MTLTEPVATRRFVGLTALRWLPNGLAVPVVVLLASSRGLTVPEVGIVFLTHGVVVTALELPTGGLADAVGYRAVLAASALVQAAGLLVLAGAQGVVGFALAFGIVGVGRALDSGPLEAWFVDAVHAASSEADVTRGLSLAGVADGLALAAGAVVGGLLPGLVGEGSRALTVPLLVAAVADVLYLLAVLALVTPLRLEGPSPSAAAAMRDGLRETPAVVRAAVSLGKRDAGLRLLFVIAFVMGAVFYTLEVLGPLHFADLAGSRTDGSAVFGIVVAVSFLASAAGSALAGPTRRALRGSAPLAIALLFVLGGLLLLSLAAATAVLLGAAAYCAFYLTNSCTGPLRRQILHSRVPSSVRASTLSSQSLCLQAGGIAAGLVVPLLAQRTSTPAAFATMGLLVAAAALVALRLPAATS